jgi:hypothetical protein
MTLLGSIVILSLPIGTSAMLKYGVPEAFYFLAGANSLVILGSLTFRPKLPRKQKESFAVKFKKSLALEVFKKTKFNIWCGASFIGYFGYMIPIVVIVI